MPVPLGVVTATFTSPAACAGVVAVMVVALTTTTPVAALPPKVTLVAPVKPVPVMVTAVPPAVVPVSGLTLVTVGACASAGALPTAVAPSAIISTASPRRRAPTKLLTFRVGPRSTGGTAAKIADAACGLARSRSAVLRVAPLDRFPWRCSTGLQALKSYSWGRHPNLGWIGVTGCPKRVICNTKAVQKHAVNHLMFRG